MARTPSYVIKDIYRAVNALKDLEYMLADLGIDPEGVLMDGEELIGKLNEQAEERNSMSSTNSGTDGAT